MRKSIVSSQDIRHLKIIRQSVSNFIRELSERYDKENKLLLDIAPQDYEKAKAFSKNV